MPTHVTPGGGVEEMPSASKPIEGVGTSIAAFVGLAPGGPVNVPRRIASWGQFRKVFGDRDQPANGPFRDGAYLAHAVHGFFQNGGGPCWVVRVGVAARPRAALPAAADKSIEAFHVEALPDVGGPVEVELSEEPAGTYELVVDAGSEGREEHEGLTLERGRSNLATKVNAASKFIKITEAAGLTDARPATGRYALSAPSVAPDELEAAHFEGLGALAAVDEITIVCMPDAMTLADGGGSDAPLRALQGKLIAHCEGAGDRMAILDAPPGLPPEEMLEWRNAAGYDSGFATLYYPWIEVVDQRTQQPILVPPSGHVAGAWCRTDAERGVHKAPANQVVAGADRLGFQVTQTQQDALNAAGVNCIRSFPGRGIRIWGARTLSSDPEWRYIPVRRLLVYIEESIAEGTRWAVFEPNDEPLWTRLRIAASDFLMRTWREGALVGAKPEHAFFVKCDATTTPRPAIEAGQAISTIGIAPVKPAEFIVFQLTHRTAGAPAGPR